MFDEFNRLLKRELLDELRKQLEEIQLDDRIRSEDNIGENELISNFWWLVFDVFEILWISDFQRGDRNILFRYENKEKFEYVVDALKKNRTDVKIQQIFV